MNTESIACLKKSLKTNPRLIGEIENPTREILEIAINSSVLALRYIRASSKVVVPEDLLLKALNKNAQCIQWISKPTEEMQKIAVSSDGSLIRHLWPVVVSEEIQILAVRNRPSAVKHIRGLSEKVLRVACEKNINAILHAEYPPLDIQQRFYESYEDKKESVELLFKSLKGNTEKLQAWLIEQGRANVLRIPRDRLYAKFRQKYKKMFVLKRVGIL